MSWLKVPGSWIQHPGSCIQGLNYVHYLAFKTPDLGSRIPHPMWPSTIFLTTIFHADSCIAPLHNFLDDVVVTSLVGPPIKLEFLTAPLGVDRAKLLGEPWRHPWLLVWQGNV